MRTILVLTIAVFALLTANARATEVVKCPTSEVGTKIFKVPLMPKTLVTIEPASETSHPIRLAAYESLGNGKCDRYIFAKYAVEGGDPNIDSLFFYKINNKLNVVTIVHWNINNRGIGTYGKLYQVYAYQIDKNNQFQENGIITSNDAMTGIDGYDDGRQSIFSLKTAKDLKKALSKLP